MAWDTSAPFPSCAPAHQYGQRARGLQAAYVRGCARLRIVAEQIRVSRRVVAGTGGLAGLLGLVGLAGAGCDSSGQAPSPKAAGSSGGDPRRTPDPAVAADARLRKRAIADEQRLLAAAAAPAGAEPFATIRGLHRAHLRVLTGQLPAEPPGQRRPLRRRWSPPNARWPWPGVMTAWPRRRRWRRCSPACPPVPMSPSACSGRAHENPVNGVQSASTGLEALVAGEHAAVYGYAAAGPVLIGLSAPVALTRPYGPVTTLTAPAATPSSTRSWLRGEPHRPRCPPTRCRFRSAAPPRSCAFWPASKTGSAGRRRRRPGRRAARRIGSWPSAFSARRQFVPPGSSSSEGPRPAHR